MKAAVVSAFGEAPRYADFPDPTAGPGLVVARVLAASLKNLDRGLVAGTHYGSSTLTPPFVPGVDGVAELPDGRRVYANAIGPDGMMAEQTVVDPDRAVVLPTEIDPALAAAIPNPGLSAWFALEYAARVQPGQSLLVLGATGVTGAVAAQLAKKRFGVGRLVVAGRNHDRLASLRDTCADDVVTIDDDLTAQVAALHEAEKFDAVLDYLWGDPAEKVLAALGNTGLTAAFHRTRFVQIGSMAGPTITLPAAILRSAGVEVIGTGLGSVPDEAQARVGTELLPELLAMVAAGTVMLDVSPQPLAQVESVWSTPAPPGTRVVMIP